MKMRERTIEEIERALRLHISYDGNSSGEYLRIMDRLAYSYSGAPAQKVSKLLDAYFKEVGVSNLDEAFERLRELDKNQDLDMDL